MKNEDELINELTIERRELLLGALNRNSKNRIDEIDVQLSELIGNDSFRSHELEDNSVFLTESSVTNILLDNYGENEYEFVSNSFHDPNLDY